MGLLSPILRNGQDNALIWWCPGCQHAHTIKHGDGPGPRWGWNGNAERPTFTPSVRVRGIREDMDESTQAAYDALGPGEMRGALDDPRFRSVCHSFVVDGQMQMLSDCTHALAGQTVPIPPWPAV
jgi:hypothetical protein